jgi:hypothetical protein
MSSSHPTGNSHLIKHIKRNSNPKSSLPKIHHKSIHCKILVDAYQTARKNCKTSVKIMADRLYMSPRLLQVATHQLLSTNDTNDTNASSAAFAVLSAIDTFAESRSSA